MDQLSTKTKRVIESGLQQCEAFLDTELGRVTGHVVAGEFDQLDYDARRKKIRAVIDQAVASGELTQTDALSVSTLLTYTPDEWKVTLPDD
jgi:acid stress-induced BolA-like protein IbaG/YrbA